MASRFGTWLALLLALTLVVYGAFDVAQHHRDAMQALRGLSVIGSGLTVLAGVVVRANHPNVGSALLVVGSVAGATPTYKTVAVPLLALVVIFFVLRGQARGR